MFLNGIDDMEWDWVWITVGVLIVIGSISWILPSPIERNQYRFRTQAIQLGLKVRALQSTDWMKDRFNTAGLTHYILRTNLHKRKVHMWRVEGRDEPWASPPDSKSWDLLDTPFRAFLNTLPTCIVGIGAENCEVWLVFNDGATDLVPTDIKILLESVEDALKKIAESES